MEKELIKKIRLTAMVTQTEFANELGVRQWTVLQWEKGYAQISLRNQRKIVEFCKNHNIDIEKIKGE